MGRFSEAQSHFASALDFNLKMRARALTAHVQCDFADMLLIRGLPSDTENANSLVNSALAETYRLGMNNLTIQASQIRQRIADTSRPSIFASAVLTEASEGESALRTDSAAEASLANLFHRDGDIWTIRYQEQTIRLRDIKGLGYIAHLLREPMREIHAEALVRACALPVPEDHYSYENQARIELSDLTQEQLAERNLRAGKSEDAGEILDSQAKAEYRRRLAELQEEIDEAREFGDADRIARAEDEIDAVGRELSRAVGRGGRDRRAGSAAERARLSVTRAIKVAIERIAERHHSLAEYLSNTIRTGTFCSYRPPQPQSHISWRFE
jgi:hypothetical protein